MTIRIALLAAACALAVTACGGREAPPAQDTTAPATTSTTPAPTPAEPAPPATTTAPPTPAPATPPAASDKPAATVSDCATHIEGTDAMQFNVSSITIPASCKTFTIHLKHTGQMPVAAMGHNVVIAKTADVQGIATDGMAAGAAAHYVKPDDARVVAHSDVIGGGQSTSVTFDPGKLKSGGPYEFFCSFPGHVAMMKGSISVE
ncbi:azurin [Agrilutibacter solisilvae]|uniref:Azurin n=1 Tax=Agrilutibacter solisilvae TaxID=2763317 RepID=A0A975ASF3_9GAMM|nr:azurin [Lysobacter solisilvae]QSX77905.1 azurin [Lysobacter solisilvae]